MKAKPLFPVYKKNVLLIDEMFDFLYFYFIKHLFLSHVQQI
jgi:hypothetical protein